MAYRRLRRRLLQKHNRPLRIAVDEAGWRFRNLNAYQVERIRESENAANPTEKVILQRIYLLLRLNIQLIFVDDGLRKPWKRGKSGGGKVDYELKKLTRQLLAQLKVPRHEAPGEAEAECARMQALGIVDAVWSDDGDSFMFGCRTLMKQHKQGNANVKDHIRIYRAEDVLQKHDLDRESLVLFALLAGGDYVKEGLPQCGQATAARVAKRKLGLAHRLCHAAKSELPKWREDLEATLRQYRCSADVPWDFPDFKALGHYRRPTISTDEQLRDLRGLRNGWDRQIDQQTLRVFLRERFNFTTREFLEHIGPILVARRLARVPPERCAENLGLGIQLKRTRKVKVKEGEEEPPAISEVKIWFSPSSIVDTDLTTCPEAEDWTKFAAKDGTPHDPLLPVECEMLSYFLEHGLPKGALVEAPPPARGRKRKGEAGDDNAASPRQKKPMSSQRDTHESPGEAKAKKRGRPSKDQADAAADNQKLKQKEKKQAAPSRSPTPPPAIFRMPEGLAELQTRARVINLCGDEEDSENESDDPDEDPDEDPDLALAVQLSLAQQAAVTSSMLLNGSFDGWGLGDEAAAPSSSTSRIMEDHPARVQPTLKKRDLGNSSLSTQRIDVTPTQLCQPTFDFKKRLLPGEPISAQTLRELRAGSTLLKGAAAGTSRSTPVTETRTLAPARSSPEVIDLT